MKKTNVSVEHANVVGLVLLVVISALVVALYLGLWGRDRAANGIEALGDSSAFVLLGTLFVSIIIHEMLHGIGFVMGGLKWRDVKFGVFWKMLTPYATSSVPMPVRTYRLATSLPGIVLGLLPAVVGLAIGNAVVTMYGAFMLAAAGGDAIVLWVTRHLHRDVIVRDCQSAVGCEVVES